MEFIKLNLDELKKEYEGGVSLRQLATKYNTSKVTIKRKLLKFGVKILSSSETLQNIDLKTVSSKRLNDEEIMMSFKSKTIQEIAAQHSTSDEAIKKVLKRNGVTLESNVAETNRLLALAIREGWDNVTNLRKLYVDNGLSATDIAKKYDVCDGVILDRLKEYKIPIRSLSEASSLAASKHRSTRSQISKRLWQDDEYRTKISKKLQNSHPKMPPEHPNNVSKAMRRLYSSGDYKSKAILILKEIWKNPTPGMLAHLMELHKNLRDDRWKAESGWLNKVTSQEHKERQSANALSMWQDPDFIANLDSLKNKVSEAAKKAWKNPNYRERVMHGHQFTSSLERNIHGILDDLNIKHRKIHPEGNEFDVAIEADQLNQDKGLLLEIQGLYWHLRDNNDAKKKQYWTDKLSSKYRFEYLWEHEFAALNSVFNRLIELLKIDIKPVTYKLNDLTFKEVESNVANDFYARYHYLSKARNGLHIGSCLNNKLVACVSFSGVTRLESAERLKMKFDEIRELSRFCIHPLYAKQNLASYALSRAIEEFKQRRPKVKKLITFADQTVGHIGTIYKATNWVQDGETAPSYYYILGGRKWHKKSIWRYAKSLKMTESEFVDIIGFEKIITEPKYRFLYDL